MIRRLVNVGMVLAFVAIVFCFGPPGGRGAQAIARAQIAMDCQGTWLMQLTIEGRDAVEQAIGTFASDGSLVLHSPPVVPALPDTGDEPVFTSDTVGSWQATGDAGCDFEGVRLLAAEDGIALSAVYLRGALTIEEGGIGLDGSFTYDQSSGSGRTVTSGTGTLVGTSISR